MKILLYFVIYNIFSDNGDILFIYVIAFACFFRGSKI